MRTIKEGLIIATTNHETLCKVVEKNATVTWAAKIIKGQEDIKALAEISQNTTMLYKILLEIFKDLLKTVDSFKAECLSIQNITNASNAIAPV